MKVPPIQPSDCQDGPGSAGSTEWIYRAVDECTNMELPIEGQDTTSLHRLLTSIVVPRPIGWMSTCDAEGRVNLAPFSYFNIASTAPPVLVFSAEPRADGSMKDSPANVTATGEFVYNLVTEGLLKRVDRTAAPLPPGENEFDIVDLSEKAARTVAPPRVGEAKAHFECVLEETLDVYGNTVVFGRVQHAHVDADLFEDGAVDATKVDAAARLGGPYYGGIDVLQTTRDYDPDL